MNIFHLFFTAVIATFVSLATPGAAIASEDVAIVEDLSVERQDLQVLDILGRGQTFRLKPDEVLTLVYLNTCIQEVITGGTVTIGTNKSRIVDGKIKAIPFDCESEINPASE